MFRRNPSHDWISMEFLWNIWNGLFLAVNFKMSENYFKILEAGENVRIFWAKLKNVRICWFRRTCQNFKISIFSKTFWYKNIMEIFWHFFAWVNFLTFWRITTSNGGPVLFPNSRKMTFDVNLSWILAHECSRI